MKKLFIILLLLTLVPTTAFAALIPVSVTRDTVAGFIRPSILSDFIKAPYFTATSSTASTFTNSSSTNLTIGNILYLPGVSNGCFTIASGIGTSTGSNCAPSIANAAWTIGSGFIINATSTDLVGIGTTTPATKLQVTGSGGTNPLRIASSTNISLLEINQAGNVGISTSTPSSKLSIVGDGSTTGSGFAIYPTASGLPNFNVLDNSFIGVNYTTPCTTSPSGFTVNTKTGCAEIRSKDATGNVLFLMRRNDNGTGFAIMNDTGVDGHTEFQNSFNSAGLAYQFKARTSGTSVDVLTMSGNGRVGLGTTSPTARLHIDGRSLAESGDLLKVENSGGATALLIDNGNMYMQGYNGGGCDNLSLGFNKGVGIGTCGGSVSSSLTLGTNNVASMYINSSNNVGVGTSTPAARLQVTGSGTTDPFRVASSSNVALFTVAANGSTTASQSIQALDYYSGDGTVGFTGTCTILSITSITVKDGLITACN